MQTQQKTLILKSKKNKSKMADQSIVNEAMTKAMAEVTRVAIQALTETQAAILNDITETHHFDKVKIAQQTKDRQDRLMHKTVNRKPCRYCVGIHVPLQCPAFG